MNADDRNRILREVSAAGSCSRPVRLRGDVVNLTTGEATERRLKVACKDRRSSVCPACSERYETDAWIIAATGLNGGKGMPDSVATLPRLFVTVTAPSFGAVHTISDRGTCVTEIKGARCAHGVASQCPVRHESSDPQLGHPLCDLCFDADGAILWNAHASRLWSLTIQQARRNLAAEASLSQRKARDSVTFHYLKVVELQRRGLVHFHALVRLDERDASIGVSIEQLSRALRQSIANVVLEDSSKEYRWGRVIDIQDLGLSGQDVRSVATYLAKYVTKSAAGSLELAFRFRSRREIRQVEDSHLRRLALAAWDLSAEQECEKFALRRHAHTLGYRGQFITKSQAYSTTFGALREARAAFMSPGPDDDGHEYTYRYDGRGYDDERSAELAEVLARLDRQRRVETRKIAKAGHDDD